MSPKNLYWALYICLLLAGGATVLASDGQPGGGERGPAGGRNQGPSGGGRPPALPDSTQIVQIVEELATTLSLTDEQKGQVSDLYFAHFAEAQSIVNRATDDRAGQRKKMDDLRNDLEKAVKAELNDEQKTRFEKQCLNLESRP